MAGIGYPEVHEPPAGTKSARSSRGHRIYFQVSATGFDTNRRRPSKLGCKWLKFLQLTLQCKAGILFRHLDQQHHLLRNILLVTPFAKALLLFSYCMIELMTEQDHLYSCIGSTRLNN
jgi:hypothetical protein